MGKTPGWHFSVAVSRLDVPRRFGFKTIRKQLHAGASRSFYRPRRPILKSRSFPLNPFERRKYSGTIRSVLDFGAFVDIGAETDGLLHISRISSERIENIYDVLSEGQQVALPVSQSLFIPYVAYNYIIHAYRDTC